MQTRWGETESSYGRSAFWDPRSWSHSIVETVGSWCAQNQVSNIESLACLNSILQILKEKLNLTTTLRLTNHRKCFNEKENNHIIANVIIISRSMNRRKLENYNVVGWLLDGHSANGISNLLHSFCIRLLFDTDHSLPLRTVPKKYRTKK